MLVGSDCIWQTEFERITSLLPDRAISINIVVMEAEWYFVLEKQAQLWKENVAFGLGGGLLVRPDQHILMVLGRDTTAEDVAGQLSSHLGLSS